MALRLQEAEQDQEIADVLWYCKIKRLSRALDRVREGMVTANAQARRQNA
jgi:hypothetical protein